MTILYRSLMLQMQLCPNVSNGIRFYHPNTLELIGTTSYRPNLRFKNDLTENGDKRSGTHAVCSVSGHRKVGRRLQVATAQQAAPGVNEELHREAAS